MQPESPFPLAQDRPEATGKLIGESLPVRKLKKSIGKMAPTDYPVLITGETGTGKELIAQMLHQLSRRADGPFIAVNCPAVPADLFQAEVFGYEKGAFTGADRQNEGRIDAARGGTLFLDEIGDLPRAMQVILLRFLQEGTFERLGSVKPIRADVRIIAATHTNLADSVATGQFRDDLFYRLNALHVAAPPLRNRGDDRLLLARHFLAEGVKKLGLRPHMLSNDACDSIVDHDWPGNIRELRNRILQALVLCESQEITARDLDLAGPDPGQESRPAIETLRNVRRNAERNAIQDALRRSRGCVETTSGQLDISRAQLYRLMKTHGISPAEFQPASTPKDGD